MKFVLFTIPVEGPERDLRLQEANNFLAQVEVRRYNAQLVFTQMGTFWSILVSYDEPQDGESSEKILFSDYSSLSDLEKKIYEALRQWRSEEAAKLKMPEFFILHNAHLVTIAKFKPRSMEDLSRIRGIGRRKINQFGPTILSIVSRFLTGET
jgi:ribonuclease D